jgi:formylglycine-generating enzyme required for sulfatase activity
MKLLIRTVLIISFAIVASGFFASGAFAALSISMVPVGSAGNPSDPDTGFGAVDYEFSMGRYEITATQYCNFLNAVATTDSYGLYFTSMSFNTNGAKISRSGAYGGYEYIVAKGDENKPIAFVGWGDAARFCNWMHNGQPSGLQDSSTTENGSYTLAGVTSDAALMLIDRNEDATWVLPNENEWYKAAYHSVDGAYYDFANKSDSITQADANYDQPNPTTGTTNVGTYWTDSSQYRTFDQTGNLWEWTESKYGNDYRAFRGGSFYSSIGSCKSDYRFGSLPGNGSESIGFRIANLESVPEPSSILMILIGVASLLYFRRIRG